MICVYVLYYIINEDVPEANSLSSARALAKYGAHSRDEGGADDGMMVIADNSPLGKAQIILLLSYYYFCECSMPHSSLFFSNSL